MVLWKADPHIAGVAGENVSVGDLALSLLWCQDKWEIPSFSITPHHLWQVGGLALGSEIVS